MPRPPHLAHQLSMGDDAIGVWMSTSCSLYSDPVPNVPMLGNVDCTPDPAACWLDAAARDFWPADASPLLAGGAAPQLGEPLDDDFCGQPRGALPHAGALERTMALGPGALPVAPKSTIACAQAGDTTGGDTTGEPGTTGDATTDPGPASGAPTTTDATTDATTAEPPTTSASDGATDPGASSGSDGPASATEGPGGQDDDSGCGCRNGQDLSVIPMLALLALLRPSRRRDA